MLQVVFIVLYNISGKFLKTRKACYLSIYVKEETGEGIKDELQIDGCGGTRWLDNGSKHTPTDGPSTHIHTTYT